MTADSDEIANFGLLEVGFDDITLESSWLLEELESQAHTLMASSLSLKSIGRMLAMTLIESFEDVL